jgi:DNA-binding transcriptional LysR family regulator
MEPGLHLVVNGVGAGFFPRTYVAEDLARGALSEIRVPGLAPLHRDIGLVRRRHAGALSPSLAGFIETLRRRADAVLKPGSRTQA